MPVVCRHQPICSSVLPVPFFPSFYAFYIFLWQGQQRIGRYVSVCNATGKLCKAMHLHNACLSLFSNPLDRIFRWKPFAKTSSINDKSLSLALGWHYWLHKTLSTTRDCWPFQRYKCYTYSTETRHVKQQSHLDKLAWQLIVGVLPIVRVSNNI